MESRQEVTVTIMDILAAKNAPQLPHRIVAGVATTPIEKAQAFVVRHRAFCGDVFACRFGPADPHDAWDADDRTTIYLVLVDGTAVASARTIEGLSRHGLQIAKFGAGLPSALDPERVAECSRVALDPNFRADSPNLRRQVLLSLFGAMVQHRWQDGHHSWVQATRWAMTRIALRLAFPLDVDPAPITFDGMSGDGVPVTGEHVFLSYVELADTALATWAFQPETYRMAFGDDALVVPFDQGRVDLLRKRIRSSTEIVSGLRPAHHPVPRERT
jgi:hypothetical protein